MKSIFDSTRPVKTTRRFGAGIPRPTRFVPRAEDEAWWAANAPSAIEAALAADWDFPAVDWDALADEAAAQDRLERGLCC
jgi:hypothetical protein